MCIRDSPVTLGPGQTTHFDQNNERPLISGHYRAEITWKVAGQDWKVTSAREFQIGDPVIPPGPQDGTLVIVGPLEINPNSLDAYETATGRFTVRNESSSTVGLSRLGIGGRGPLGNDIHDFPWHWFITLLPGEEYTYQDTRSFTTSGSYFFFPAYQSENGEWREIYSSNGARSVASAVVNSPATGSTGWSLAVNYMDDSNEVIDVSGGNVEQLASGKFVFKDFTLANRSLHCRFTQIIVNGTPLQFRSPGGWSQDWVIGLPGDRATINTGFTIPASQFEIRNSVLAKDVPSQAALTLCNLAATVLVVFNGDISLAENGELTSVDTLWGGVTDAIFDGVLSNGDPNVAVELAIIYDDIIRGEGRDAFIKILTFAARHPDTVSKLIFNLFGVAVKEGIEFLDVIGKILESWFAIDAGARLIESNLTEPSLGIAVVYAQQTPSNLKTYTHSSEDVDSKNLALRKDSGVNWAGLAGGGQIVGTSNHFAAAEQARLIDGDYSKGWETDKAFSEYPNSTIIELASETPVTITEIRIHPGPIQDSLTGAALKEFRVDSSLDGIEYFPILYGSFGSEEVGQQKSYTIDHIPAQYVKIIPETSQDANSLTLVIGELEVYGNMGMPGDEYEPDNASNEAGEETPDAFATQHNANYPGDLDWVRFKAFPGATYTIETLGLGNSADTIITLFDQNGTTPLIENDNGGSGNASKIEWTVESYGTYFVRVQQSLGQYGPETSYQLSIRLNPSNLWYAEYYENQFLGGEPVVIRADDSIDFYWDDGSPSPEVPADYFSARWTRSLHLPAGSYDFSLYRDDGARLWIDGESVFDKWEHTAGYNSFQIYLSEGTHLFQFEMFEMTGGAAAILSWQYAGGSHQLFLPSVVRN